MKGRLEQELKEAEFVKSGKGVGLFDDEIWLLVLGHYAFRKNTNEIGRQFGYSPTTVGKYLKLLGLEVTRSVDKLKQKDVDVIVEAHRACNGNVRTCSTRTKHGYKTVVRCWNEEGLKPRKEDYNYHGFPSPLEFFMVHPQIRKLRRYELSKRYPGLYRALLRKGQLEKAIPRAWVH